METTYMSPFILAANFIIAIIFAKIYLTLEEILTKISNANKLKYLANRLNDELFKRKATKIYNLYLNYYKVICNDIDRAKLNASLEVANLAKKNKINEKYRLIEEFKI